jgi:hypothetical protein
MGAGKAVGHKRRSGFTTAWSRIGFEEKVFKTKIPMKHIQTKKEASKIFAGLFSSYD